MTPTQESDVIGLVVSLLLMNTVTLAPMLTLPMKTMGLVRTTG